LGIGGEFLEKLAGGGGFDGDEFGRGLAIERLARQGDYREEAEKVATIESHGVYLVTGSAERKEK
jgi:hypothetical protein